MLLLATQGMPQMRAHAHPNLGRLVTPRHYPSMHEHPDELVFAADNDCFQGDEPAWLQMLDALSGAGGELKFATVPDVVGDAYATARMFARYAPELEARGLPLALVLQDGIDELDYWLRTVWHRLDAVFVGGSTEFKLGPVARELVDRAKGDGKWAHMGRVNSRRRIDIARSFGCDSVDGTKWVRWRNEYLDDGLAYLAAWDRVEQGRVAA